MYPWRRFRSAHASCVSGSEKGVNYTSHHLRCERIDSTASRRLRQGPSELASSKSWPGTTPPQEEEDDSYSNVFTPQPELRYTHHDDAKEPSRKPQQSPASTHLQLLRAPPQCRLPTSMRFTTLLLYITLALLFISRTAAAPLSNSHAHLHKRQAVPDRFGNTGNEPAPVASLPPPQTLTPSPTSSLSATAFASSTSTPSSTTLMPSTTPQPTTTVTTGSNGNGNSNPNNNGDGLGLNPGENGNNPPAEELTRIAPQLSMSPGALAGIIGGGVAVLSIVIGLIVYFYRRARRPDIAEIPIRRSKLGSRLGRRIFGSPLPSRSGSRSSSRRTSASSARSEKREKQIEAGAVDKGTISKPKAAWLENGLLSVPRPAFVREERERASGVDEGAPWVQVDKGTISAPRPGRPASAEPLGRLSGMGLGMGYLK